MGGGVPGRLIRSLARLPARAWVGVAALLAAGTLLAMAWPQGATRLDWQPSLAATEPWRIWSAAFVHLSPAHFAGNLLAALLVSAFGGLGQVPLRTAAAWLAAWPLTHIALGAWPELQHYGGLSGVMHAGVAAAALHLATLPTPRDRLIGVLSIAALIAKVLTEAPWRGAVQRSPSWDIPIAPVAHATGLAAGLVCSGLAELWARLRGRRALAP